MTGTLTLSDVAKAANVTRATIYKWKRNGRFNVAPLDNFQPPRWAATDIAAWLKAATPENAAE